MIETATEKTRAYVIGIRQSGQPEREAQDLTDELAALCRSVDLAIEGREVARLRTPHPRYLLGRGKAAEIADLLHREEIGCLIIDYPLSPSQQRNWEELTGGCVVDRQEIILDIFARRASTKAAILQVALARMEYSLPRLTRAWTHLSRQRGGTKGTRGEGETQLEVDRRLVLEKIKRIKKELQEVEKNRRVQRKRRTALTRLTAALVGYTNAGKSSLLKKLTGAEVLVEDQLFATLDPTSRRLRLPSGREVVLTDTVGFIRNIPHQLIKAFHATLEETVNADILIHVIDSTDPEARLHYDTAREVLAEIGAGDKPVITVLNKSDRELPEGVPANIPVPSQEIIRTSAETGAGLDLLLKRLEAQLDGGSERVELRIPLADYGLAAELHREGYVEEERFEGDFVLIRALMPLSRIPKVAPFRSS